IVSLCKRRGFIFQSSEIYGGLNGLWDYGPLGVELKRNLKNYWWRVMVHERDDIVGMDGSILMNRAVWKASGHEDTFSDPMVDCLTTGKRLRADQIEPQSGWVASFFGAVDSASWQKLLQEQGAPERSAVWSQVDLAPILRRLLSNLNSGSHEGVGGFVKLQESDREQAEALKRAVGRGLFMTSSLDPFSAMDIGSGRKGHKPLFSSKGFSPAITTALEYYRKRGIPEPIVFLATF